MRLDLFLKCLDSSTQVKINLITAEPDKEIITVIGTKEEVIPTLISKDISDFDVFDIYISIHAPLTGCDLMKELSRMV